MLLDSTKMTDKELDEAITNHMNKLNDLDVTDTEKKIKLNTSEFNNSNDLYYMNYIGDWNGNSQTLSDAHLNMITTGNCEWKCKTPYSVTNPNHPSKCNIYSNIYPDNTKQKNKYQLNDELNENKFNFLNKIRRYLVNYQEKQGISKTDYPFSELIRIIGEIMAKSLLVLFYIIINIAPMTQIVLFIVRFILDKIINIQRTKDKQQMALKTIFLMFQLSCVYICLTFIIGLIWIPILNIILRIISCCTIDHKRLTEIKTSE